MVKLNSALVSGSLVLLITFNIFNFLNFVFQFSMARLLTAAEYGVLAALFSIIYVLSIFTESIQTVMAKYSATENDKGKVKNLFHKTLKKSFYVSCFLMIFYLIISIFLSPLLKVPYALLALNGLMIVGALILPVARGIMQGTKRFKSLGANLMIESLGKLIIAISLVLFFSTSLPTLKLYGALTGMIIGTALAFGASIISLKDFRNVKEKEMKTPHIYAQTRPIFFLTLAVIAFYSIDVIIAKIVFSEEVAGYYAIAAVLAKAIFWGTLPISKALFPLATKNKEKKASKLFLNAFLILLACIIVALLVFFLSPLTLIKIFSGKLLNESAQILFFLGIAMSLLALSNLILLYKISRGKTQGYLYLLLPLILEAIILFAYHETLIKFSLGLIFSSVIFLLISLMVLRK